MQPGEPGRCSCRPPPARRAEEEAAARAGAAAAASAPAAGVRAEATVKARARLVPLRPNRGRLACPGCARGSVRKAAAARGGGWRAGGARRQACEGASRSQRAGALLPARARVGSQACALWRWCRECAPPCAAEAGWRCLRPEPEMRRGCLACLAHTARQAAGRDCRPSRRRREAPSPFGCRCASAERSGLRRRRPTLLTGSGQELQSAPPAAGGGQLQDKARRWASRIRNRVS